MGRPLKYQKGPLVYLAVNLVNGHRYVGICSGYLSQRISKHFYCAEKGRTNMPFCHAIRKHGRDMFRFFTLSKHETYTEAAEQERRLIALWKPDYNAASGGLGNPGWKHSAEAIRKMSEAHKGQPAYWKGKKLPEHVGRMVTERNMKPQRRAQWRENAKMGPVSLRKAVVCLDDGKIYQHAADAATSYGVNKSAVCEVCNRHGAHKTAGGLVFRYFGDHLGGKEEAEEVRRQIADNRCRTAAIARKARQEASSNGTR